VDDEKLRFDFNNNKPVNAKTLGKIEKEIQDDIAKSLGVYYKDVSLKEAKEIYGLRAVFGEVYPDPVRVVSIGKSVEDLMSDPKAKENYNLSIEFCGGTHLDNTKEAESFAILNEEGIAKGVRRILAATGKLASEAIARAATFKARVAKLDGVKEAAALEAQLGELKREVDSVTMPTVAKSEIKDLLAKHSKRVVDMGKKAAAANKKKAVDEAVQFVKAKAAEGKNACVLKIDVGADTKALTEAVDASLKAEPSFSMIVFSSDDGKKKKVLAYAGVSKDAIAKGLDAPKWVRESLAICGGKGGGKPDRAQGQGSKIENLAQAMAKAEELAATLG